MYEELIKRLRRCEQFRCGECEYENVLGCRAKLNSEAADTIDKQNVIISGLNETIKMYANETPQWIPVTERLPDEMVLACYGRGNIAILEYSHRYKFWENEHGYFCNTSCVTHWMPLPEPPKEET